MEGTLREMKDQNQQGAAVNKMEANKVVRKDDSSYFQPRLRLNTDQSVFKVYKGVKTFAFSKAKNVIVTGGRFYLSW